MRSINANLTSGQRGLMLLPALDVRVKGNRAGIETPAWTKVEFTDTERRHAGVVLANGYVGRVMVNSATNYVHVQAVAPASRDTPSAWSTWGNLWQGGSPAVRPGACASGTDGNVHFFVRHHVSANIIRWFASTNYGSSWAAPVNIVTLTAGYVVTGLAAAYVDASGDMFLMYTYDPGGAGADDVLALRRYTASTTTWGAEVAWTDGAKYSFDGIDCFYSADLYMTAAGRESASPYDRRLWTLAYGDGGYYPAGVWVGKSAIELSDDVNYRWFEPSMCNADVARIAVGREYGGTGGETRIYTLAHTTQYTAAAPYWTEPAPQAHEPTAGYGVVLRYDATNHYLYLIGHDAVWYAEILGYDSLSSRVLAYDYREGKGGGLQMVLDNRDGLLAEGASSDYARLKVGSELYLQRGLKLAGTDYVAPLPPVWIEELRWHQRKGVDLVELRCLDWQGLLSKWRATRVMQWDAKLGSQIGAALCAKVGLEFVEVASEGSAEMTALSMDFVVRAGEDGLGALRRLMRRVPDVLRSDGQEGVAYKELSDAEASDYALGGSGEHPIREAYFAEAAGEYNGISVQGASDILGEEFDLDLVDLVGFRHKWIGDVAYTTAGEAAAQAGAELLRERADRDAGWIRVFPIHGLEIWDVLGITYSRGWSGTRKYRVTGIREVLDRDKGTYEQQVWVVRIA